MILNRLEEKSFLPAQSCAAPPQPPRSRFWSSRIENVAFEPFSEEKVTFLSLLSRAPEGPPGAENCYRQQIDQNRPM